MVCFYFNLQVSKYLLKSVSSLSTIDLFSVSTLEVVNYQLPGHFLLCTDSRLSFKASNYPTSVTCSC
jgi:hypothetical protein